MTFDLERMNLGALDDLEEECGVTVGSPAGLWAFGPVPRGHARMHGAPPPARKSGRKHRKSKAKKAKKR